MTAQPEPVERDYAAEMSAFIQKNQPQGDAVVATHAEKLVRKLLQKDPDLLQGWLLMMAVPLLSDSLRETWRYERRTARRRRFAKALQEGDPEALQKASTFDTEKFVIDQHNTWRYLGDMTGKDHRFVAEKYEDRSKELQMRAAFHRAIAKKVGNKKTAEVLSVAQYSDLWRRMSGN